MEAVDLGQLLSAQQDRRIRVIENLLRGKKTVSTLYWGQRYRLLPLLNLDKHLQRGGLDTAIQDLQHQGWVTVDPEQATLRLTSTGEQQLADQAYYRPVTTAQWVNLDLVAARQRLLLAVQVTSQFAHSTARYYPLATDQETRRAVRVWFHRRKSPALASQLGAALTASLQQLPQQTAGVVTDQFTGFGQPGLTSEQLAVTHQWTTWEVRLMQVDGVVQIAQDARQADHPLHELLGPLWQVPISRSAQATLAAVEAGGDLARVATVRKIKLSTVREHLLEAAIMSPLRDFPYDQVLPETVRQDLASALHGSIDDWQYTALPTALQAQYDFFYFRLYAIWRIKEATT
ncbi:helix-turn-helix domain-containing protein [Levilactobacillus angrenensis]|uniref:Helix-turn-helix domain-containing protein n=1 Tax=Levilactobacillus angrenensis TaxID=2486020 RepID=A0ABW1U7U0_9LACO|nr:helix-turn-helix domain-containing protein [Levilactobacillus angrenensis]